MSGQASYLYAGLASDLSPTFPEMKGLFRSKGGTEPWQRIDAAIDPVPQVRAILLDARRPGRVLVGTQAGIWRSDDRGDTWRKTGAPAPSLAVWSLAAHPNQPDTIFAGYEPVSIHRSDDGGMTWRDLGVNVTFPEVTEKPEEHVKRVIDIAIDPTRPDDIYAAVEIGGLIRSRDGGKSWACVSEGLYVNEDPLDLHQVVVSPAHGGVVSMVGRIGLFRSKDGGDHWGTVAVPGGTPKRRPYCRQLVVAPDDPNTLLLGTSPVYESENGLIFRSTDFGMNWSPVDLGAPARGTVFAITIDQTQPKHIFCGVKTGDVYASHDGGQSWKTNPLPAGARQLYTLKAG